MTTIAWDGQRLAADRRINYGSVSDASHTKIVKNKEGDLCGVAGTTSLCEGFKTWFVKGERGKKPPTKDGEERINALVIRKNGDIFMHDELGYYKIDAGIHAIGSGYQIALGAMEMGAEAARAVEVAAKFDSNTGKQVDELWLK